MLSFNEKDKKKIVTALWILKSLLERIHQIFPNLWQWNHKEENGCWSRESLFFKWRPLGGGDNLSYILRDEYRNLLGRQEVGEPLYAEEKACALCRSVFLMCFKHYYNTKTFLFLWPSKKLAKTLKKDSPRIKVQELKLKADDFFSKDQTLCYEWGMGGEQGEMSRTKMNKEVLAFKEMKEK